MQKKLPELHHLFQNHKIKKAYVFGSVVTKMFNDSSDIDVLINYDDDMDPAERGEHLIQLNDDLENLFNRKVDLVTEKYLRNPYFIKSINQNKQLVYG